MPHFAEALLPGGWARDVRIEFEGGLIAALETDTKPRPTDDRHAVGLPGLPNLHSHAFQRAMAGLAERRSAGPETFWSWRDVMYRFVAALTPEDVTAIAALAYMEMLEAGFTRVGEFHYLHHDPAGQRYADRAELCARIGEAADQTGIGLTLLPVFYAHGNFNAAPPSEGQRRFLHEIDGFAALLDAAGSAIAGLPDAVLGVAPHSLRAVTADELAACVSLAAGRPIHIHVAEQRREVEDCVAATGARPIEYLLDRGMGDGWCAVHATHMTPAETSRLAASGAVAGLCPVTEANLGDGVFDGVSYRSQSGRFGVGTDSNILIGAADELRMLEYSQRLALQGRTMMAPAGQSTGRALFEAALEGGAGALGVEGGLRVGAAGDVVSLDAAHASLVGRSLDGWLDGWVFAADRAVDMVWRRGRTVVRGGRHVGRGPIVTEYARRIGRLMGG